MRITPRVFLTSGLFADDNRWLSQVAPREEDCFTGEDYEFVATEALHVVLFVGTGAKDVYNHLDVREEPDALRVIDGFPKFPSSRTICYIEEGLAIENDEASGTTDFTEAVAEREVQVTAICEQLAPEGFEYQGRFDYRVSDQVRAIGVTIREHWGIE